MADDEIDLYGDLDDSTSNVDGGGDDLYSDIVSSAAVGASASEAAAAAVVTQTQAQAAPSQPPPRLASDSLVAAPPERQGLLVSPPPSISHGQDVDPLAHDPLSAMPKTAATKASVYIGNFYWWTTDQNLIEACSDVGVHDVTRVQIHIERTNGKSKGYGLIELGSDQSAKQLAERLPQRLVDLKIDGGNKFLVALSNSMPMTQFAQLCGIKEESVGRSSGHNRRRAPNSMSSGGGGSGSGGGGSSLPAPMMPNMNMMHAGFPMGGGMRPHMQNFGGAPGMMGAFPNLPFNPNFTPGNPHPMMMNMMGFGMGGPPGMLRGVGGLVAPPMSGPPKGEKDLQALAKDMLRYGGADLDDGSKGDRDGRRDRYDRDRDRRSRRSRSRDRDRGRERDRDHRDRRERRRRSRS